MGDPCKSLPQQVNTFSRYKCHIYLAFLHFCLFTSSLPYFHPPPASHLTNTNGGKKTQSPPFYTFSSPTIVEDTQCLPSPPQSTRPSPLTWNPLADHPPQDTHTGVMVHVQKSHLIVFLAENEEKLRDEKKIVNQITSCPVSPSIKFSRNAIQQK